MKALERRNSRGSRNADAAVYQTAAQYNKAVIKAKGESKKAFPPLSPSIYTKKGSYVETAAEGSGSNRASLVEPHSAKW